VLTWVERDHYLQCIELWNILAVFGCGWASFAVEVVSAALHSVFGENGRMIPPLQVVYTAWAPGPAYMPSLLKTRRNVFAVFGCIWASFTAGAGSAASHSVFGENGRMIPPLQAEYTAWALGLAYTPSSL